MLLNKRVAFGSPATKLEPCNVKRNPSLAYVPPIRASATCPKFRSLSTAYQERKPLSLRGGFTRHLSGGINFLSKWRPWVCCKADGFAGQEQDGERPRSSVVCKASKSFFTYPKMTSKPKWWWRTLACIPYLLPLHYVWSYADTAYQLHHVVEGFEFLTNPFLDTIALLANWFMMGVLFRAYTGVVKRKEWPHFLRFHVIMALLLDTALQAMAIACGWMPNAVYRARPGVYFWVAAAFVQMHTLLECMRCALAGKYADVPFVSDAAYFHTDLVLFGL